tara:strand:- start:2617 stop:3513 length:897 start_codon:yes stop_codon:yes gene_type:complete
MTVATGNFAELLWPGIRTTFGSDYGDYKSVYSRVFNVVRSTQTFEKDQGVTGLPLAGVKEQGSPAPYVDPVQGYQKEYVHVTYGLGSSVTREMWEDDQYRYINRIPRMLARSMRQTEETTHANVLNNAFTTETGADGVAVIAATHPNAATATTQSNQPSTAADLTQTSMEQAIIDIMGWTDDQDLKISVQPRLLVVPRQLRYTAQKILMTSGEVGSADNTINPMNDAMEMVSWVFLTDPDAWFVCTDQTEAGLMSFVRRNAEIDRDNEFDTQNLKFLTTKRWDMGVTDWRSIYGSAGA